MRSVLFAGCLAAGAAQAGQIDTAVFNGLRRGMAESEVLLRAGEPDLITEAGGGVLIYDDYGAAVANSGSRIKLHYMPGPEEHDPWITIITVINGTVTALERRKVFGALHVPPTRDDDSSAVMSAPAQRPLSDDDIRRERADRTLEAAQRYSVVRTRIKDRESANADSQRRPVYRSTDDAGVPYFGDVPARADAEKR
jgi:hypothetical protein